MTRKERVAAAFSAAARTYETSAEAQILAAERLAELVLAEPLPTDPRVLEIGCGTGVLTQRLLPKVGGRWTITDLSPTMVECARSVIDDPLAEFRVMDGEAPDPGGPFDLIVSNLAAQWFSDLPGALGRLAAMLAPGGRMAISTLGARSFVEWREAHDALGLECGVPTYPGMAALMAMTPPGGRAGVIHRPFVVRYPDGRSFARALKSIGAGTPRADHRPLGSGSMRRVLAALGTPVEMTYDVMILTFVAEHA